MSGTGTCSLVDSVRNGIDKLSPNRKSGVSGVGSEIGWFRVVNQELIENEVINDHPISGKKKNVQG